MRTMIFNATHVNDIRLQFCTFSAKPFAKTAIMIAFFQQPGTNPRENLLYNKANG